MWWFDIRPEVRAADRCRMFIGDDPRRRWRLWYRHERKAQRELVESIRLPGVIGSCFGVKMYKSDGTYMAVPR